MSAGSHFKFQSDSINTLDASIRSAHKRTLNSNLILLILADALYTDTGTSFKFQSDSINTSAGTRSFYLSITFKFQSDSINTRFFFSKFINCIALNSNLILLIPDSSGLSVLMMFTLNSNLILLIPVFKDTFKTTSYNTYFCRPKK